jgi:hypothetical protein
MSVSVNCENKVHQHPCTCICHTHKNVMHIINCCNYVRCPGCGNMVATSRVFGFLEDVEEE